MLSAPPPPHQWWAVPVEALTNPMTFLCSLHRGPKSPNLALPGVIPVSCICSRHNFPLCLGLHGSSFVCVCVYICIMLLTSSFMRLIHSFIHIHSWTHSCHFHSETTEWVPTALGIQSKACRTEHPSTSPLPCSACSACLTHQHLPFLLCGLLVPQLCAWWVPLLLQVCI